jgi:hypothetical protein
MIGKLVKLIAYSQAPKATFAVLHPRAAAQLKFAKWDARHGWAPRAAAVGAILIALPIGYMLAKLTQPRPMPRIRPQAPVLDDFEPQFDPRQTELL